jgi:hypothetical protein
VITTEENVIHRIYMTENTVPIRFAVSNDGDAIVKISAIIKRFDAIQNLKVYETYMHFGQISYKNRNHRF